MRLKARTSGKVREHGGPTFAGGRKTRFCTVFTTQHHRTEQGEEEKKEFGRREFSNSWRRNGRKAEIEKQNPRHYPTSTLCTEEEDGARFIYLIAFVFRKERGRESRVFPLR